ncbi:ataxin-7-like protein 2b isoform X1 [Pungitius pungitius]|uniref:ataxin-7-like protein 2b isoform X1 n=1 Tax=Pungitius pungitius TaxID=134920 RepID=UPI002E12B6C2
MAALDRRNPNLDDFVGLNWSCWVERVNILPSDAGSNVDDSGKHVRNPPETMTLKKEDMHTFGHCPAHDDIYLVMCSHCGQVVKPQAFEKHCERRHGPLPKMRGQSPASASQQRRCPARTPANHTSSRERRKDGRCHEASVPSSSSSTAAAAPVHQHRPGKAQQDAVSSCSVEKFPHEKSPLPHHSSSTPCSNVPPRHSGAELPSVQKPTASQSRGSRGPLRRTRTYSRTYKNISKKKCDLNKPCGVLDPERKELCSQELICNTDSIHQQQKALGRTKTFDQLTEEQKTPSADGDTEQLLVNEQQQPLQTSITSNSILRSGVPSESIPEAEGESSAEVEAQPQIPFSRSMVSGEESDDGRQQEAVDLSATPWHPKPLGLCTFGCRTLGCSIFTFNRRWHHLRFALGAMLERHVSTHLWKKMPQVSSGLRSCHVTHATVGSPVRTATPTKSTVSLSLKSTSLGPLETKTSQHNTQSTKPPSSTTSVRFMQDASAAQKVVHIGEEKASKYIRGPVLNEKGQPHLPSLQGTVNGTFSRKKKPCLPLHAPRSRGRPLGIQQKVVGYDQRGPAQKRKDGSESQPLGSRTKCQRLSSPPQRGEKMERITGTRTLWAWRKDPTPEKSSPFYAQTSGIILVCMLPYVYIFANSLFFYVTKCLFVTCVIL